MDNMDSMDLGSTLFEDWWVDQSEPCNTNPYEAGTSIEWLEPEFETTVATCQSAFSFQSPENGLMGLGPVHATQPLDLTSTVALPGFQFDVCPDIFQGMEALDFSDPNVQDFLNGFQNNQQSLEVVPRITGFDDAAIDASSTMMPQGQVDLTSLQSENLVMSVDTRTAIEKTVKSARGKSKKKRLYDDYLQSFPIERREGENALNNTFELPNKQPAADDQRLDTSLVVWKLPGNPHIIRQRTEKEKANKKAMTGKVCLRCMWDRKKCDMSEKCNYCTTISASNYKRPRNSATLSPWSKIDFCIRIDGYFHSFRSGFSPARELSDFLYLRLRIIIYDTYLYSLFMEDSIINKLESIRDHFDYQDRYGLTILAKVSNLEKSAEDWIRTRGKDRQRQTNLRNAFRSAYLCISCYLKLWDSENIRFRMRIPAIPAPRKALKLNSEAKKEEQDFVRALAKKRTKTFLKSHIPNLLSLCSSISSLEHFLEQRGYSKPRSPEETQRPENLSQIPGEKAPEWPSNYFEYDFDLKKIMRAWEGLIAASRQA